MISKVLVALVAAVSAVLAAPQYNPYYGGGLSPYGAVPITSQHYDLNPDGSYSFSYRSGDGSARDEVGALRGLGPAGAAMAVQGQYSYQSPEGPVAVQYVADENGFQPNGPGVHPAIVQAVAQQVAEARANPYQGQYDGPAYRPGPGAYYQGGPFRRY